MKKSVVTGGAGFVGSHIVELLLKEGHEVHIIENFAGGKRDDRLFSDAQMHEGDICDTKAMQGFFAGADYVFHVAALPRVQDTIDRPIETARVNVDGTLSVLEAARHVGVQKLVFTSSAAIYGDTDTFPLKEDMPAAPKSPYALHKYIGERYMQLWSQLYGIPTVCIRPFNVYGSRSDPSGAYPLVTGKFLEQKKKGEPLVIIGDGSITRDYVSVRDIARGHLMAAENPNVKSGEVINLGTGIETSVNQIAEYVGGPTTHVPPRIEPLRSVADITRTKELLGWEPSISVKEGLEELKKEMGIS